MHALAPVTAIASLVAGPDGGREILHRERGLIAGAEPSSFDTHERGAVAVNRLACSHRPYCTANWITGEYASGQFSGKRGTFEPSRRVAEYMYLD